MSKSGIPIVSPIAEALAFIPNAIGSVFTNDAGATTSPLQEEVKPAPAPPTPDQPAIQAKMDEAEKAEAKPRSRAATVLTRKRGIMSDASYARRTLLGE
jgi:hypothetical protein